MSATEPATFMKSFTQSILMIITSELGDKTFIIAAMLAMKHNYMVVFAGAAGALFLMTVLSAAMGSLISRWLPACMVHYACIGLFLIFGAKLLWEAVDDAGENEEIKEVELELKQVEETVNGGAVKYGNDSSPSDIEKTGSGPASPVPVVLKPAEPEISLSQKLLGFVYSLCKTQNGRVASEAFILTFLGEWGDRSQMATVSMAAAGNAFGVTVGGLIGHLLCTALAVVGGKMLATRISMRHVNIAGGLLFLAFAVHGLIVGPEN